MWGDVSAMFDSQTLVRLVGILRSSHAGNHQVVRTQMSQMLLYGL